MSDIMPYEASWRVKLIIWIARCLGFDETAVQVLDPYVPFTESGTGRQRITVEQLIYMKKVDRRPVKYKLERAG